MVNFENIPAWLPGMFALALLGVLAHLIRTWRQKRALERKNAKILMAQRRDAAKWEEIQQKLRQERDNDPSA